MSRTDPERFALLSRLFDEIVALDPAEREEAVRARCGDDQELAQELKGLMQADVSGDPDSFLGRVVSDEAAALGPPDVTGRTLGSWRIVEPLAEGGMGTVYVVERADGAYDARAAVKLVRGGVPSARLDARLREERQILAGLSHPGIAKLLDGGSTDDGTPYLVMELIDGVPITDWCEQQALDVEGRLRLFLKVCDAVAYAHGELIAHRDLKPSNILVTRDGDPKLLDFGIAKLVDALEESSDDATRSASLMTPSYASPEQVSGRRAGVSTDVYALGVLLYELLTGRLPLATRGLTPIALQKLVLVEVPPLPSTVAPSGEIRRRLSGDLDAVVSRALRKEAGERYANVRALADDLERHLSGLPVRVRHDDWAYRTGKFVRRNAGAVSGGVILMVTLVSFTLSTLLQARAIAAERDRADEQRATAERVSAFLEELLTEADPNEASGREITAREVLDRGSARVLADLETEPAIQAALATVMGRINRVLGEYDAARPLLDSALVVRQRVRPTDPVALAESLVERGALAYDLGAYEEAEALHREALASYRLAIEGDDQRVADAIDWIASSLTDLGRLDEAEELSRESLAINRRLHSDEPSEALAVSLINLADILRGNGAYEEARTLGEEGLGIMRAVHGDVHLEVAWALNQLASTLSRGGSPELAVPLVEEGLAVRREVFDGPHAEIAASLGNLGNILRSLGRVEEAEAARRESVSMLREIFPDDHPYVAASVFSLGELLLGAGRLEEALPTLEEAVALHRAVFPPGHPNVGYPLTSLGRALLASGDPVGAEVYLREAYDSRRAGLPEGHWHVAASGLELGRALDAQGRTEEAERYLGEALELLTATLGPDDERTGQARDALREHYLTRGLADRAAQLGG